MLSSGSISSAPISSVIPMLPVTVPLSWDLVTTGHIPYRARRATTSQNPLLMNISPIPQPAPPVDMTWQPQFPSHPARRRFSAYPQPIFVPTPPIFYQSWAPVFRVQATLRRPIRGPQVIMGDIGALPEIAKFPTWQTVWTAPIRRRAQRLQESVYRTDMTTILNAAPCVELGDETLTNPALGAETLVNPSFGSETLVNPTFASEDVC